MAAPEKEYVPLTTEERILLDFGYGDFVHRPLVGPDGLSMTDREGHEVMGGNFLDTYASLDKRQHTQDLLDGFLEMDPGEEDYTAAKQMIQDFLTAQFGEPSPIEA